MAAYAPLAPFVIEVKGVKFHVGWERVAMSTWFWGGDPSLSAKEIAGVLTFPLSITALWKLMARAQG